MEFTNAEKYACVDCNLGNMPPSKWTIATHLVPLKNGKIYAMCEHCREKSIYQPKTPLYFDWLDRVDKIVNIKIDAEEVETVPVMIFGIASG